LRKYRLHACNAQFNVNATINLINSKIIKYSNNKKILILLNSKKKLKFSNNKCYNAQ